MPEQVPQIEPSMIEDLNCRCAGNPGLLPGSPGAETVAERGA